MKKRGLAIGVLLIVVGAAIWILYQNRNTKDGREAVPAEPEYADATQWYVSNRKGEADVFYIISTETGDYRLADGQMCQQPVQKALGGPDGCAYRGKKTDTPAHAFFIPLCLRNRYSGI